jgi:hypothetical protein
MLDSAPRLATHEDDKCRNVIALIFVIGTNNRDGCLRKELSISAEFFIKNWYFLMVWPSPSRTCGAHPSAWKPLPQRSKVKVALRLTVSLTCGAHDQILVSVWQLLSCPCEAPSLTRGRVCRLSAKEAGEYIGIYTDRKECICMGMSRPFFFFRSSS